MAKFTAALKVIDANFDGHITLCFCDAIKGGKVSTSNHRYEAEIVGVSYWKHVNLTVMLVKSEYASERHKYYNDNGYTYDHVFIPHITVGGGDVVSEFKKHIGDVFYIGDEYIRIY